MRKFKLLFFSLFANLLKYNKSNYCSCIVAIKINVSVCDLTQVFSMHKCKFTASMQKPQHHHWGLCNNLAIIKF